MRETGFDVIDTCEEIDFDEVSALLKYYGLSDLESEVQRKVFQNSYVTIFIKDKDKLIGVGRAISDGICQAAVYNIAVRDEYRGLGIGRTIVEEIISRLKGCNVVLYTHPKPWPNY